MKQFNSFQGSRCWKTVLPNMKTLNSVCISVTYKISKVRKKYEGISSLLGTVM